MPYFASTRATHISCVCFVCCGQNTKLKIYFDDITIGVWICMSVHILGCDEIYIQKLKINKK